jgi:nascent polypeptide-associated complex subunit alpha
MFPGGMNPKNMSRMMKQFGIKSDELEAKKVVIELKDGKKLVFDEPQVQCMEVQGNKTYTVIGTPAEEKSVPEEDITMVAEQAGVSPADAKEALKKADGDIAQAIMDLKERE